MFEQYTGYSKEHKVWEYGERTSKTKLKHYSGIDPTNYISWKAVNET